MTVDYRSELFDIAARVLASARDLDTESIVTVQDAITLLHSDWQSLHNALRSERVDKLSEIVNVVVALAATATAAAAILQAKTLNQQQVADSIGLEEDVFAEPGCQFVLKTAARKTPPRRR